MRAASAERWAEAQQAERSFWDPSTYKLEVFSATIASLGESAAWLLQHASGDLPGGDRVELGIGPMGLGCLHLVPAPAGSRLVGVDPLDQRPASEWPLPEPHASILKAFQGSYDHVIGRAEDTALTGGSFGIAALHNMLDHVQEPAAVIAEAHRLLRTGGLLFVACDTISAANQFRMKLYTRRRFADTLFIRAHPFHFRAGQLMRLMRGAGFRVLATNRRRPAIFYEAAGHAYRLMLLGEKT